MSSKLDQSLDEILAERPRVGAAGRRGARSGNAPAGGIRKRPQRAAAQKASATITQNATKTVPTGPSGKVAGSKIIVSNLPYDVDEAMIKTSSYNFLILLLPLRTFYIIVRHCILESLATTTEYSF
jgi:THO complex subunit 4